MEINKTSDTEIEITTSVTSTIDITKVQAELQESIDSLAELETRYSEQKANLELLITKNQDLIAKAESVGVVITQSPVEEVIE